MTPYHYDTDAIIAGMRSQIDLVYGSVLSRDLSPGKRAYILLQQRVAVAMLDIERLVIDMMNEGCEFQSICEAVGSAYGASLGGKVSSAIEAQDFASARGAQLRFATALRDAIEGASGETADKINVCVSYDAVPGGTA